MTELKQNKRKQKANVLNIKTGKGKYPTQRKQI